MSYLFGLLFIIIILFIAECSLGNYGFNCIESCYGCLSDSCDTEYGVCENTTGCKPGWQHGQPGQQKCDIGIKRIFYLFFINIILFTFHQ